MPRVALLCPNEWDRALLASPPARVERRFDILPLGDDVHDSLGTFDVNTFIDDTVSSLRRAGVDGVTSSGDYPGILVASFVAQELGLPGPAPNAVLTCSHKYYSRLAQQDVVPLETPQFELFDPQESDPTSIQMPYPLFVKPVKSWFSQFARQVDTFEELAEYASSPDLVHHLTDFVRPFNALLNRSGRFEVDASWLILEEVLTGRQVTLEGYVFSGRTDVVGVVDSIMYGDTLSFRYFGYPSTLIPPGVVDRMRTTVDRVLAHIGFDNGLFNVEFMYDERVDEIRIIEINPRMCGQFADLMESVNGVNTYETLFDLSLGERPLPGVGGVWEVAASFALRYFGDALVDEVPDDAVIGFVRSLLPVTSFHSFYQQGDRLSDQSYEFDGASYRYAVVNLAGSRWNQLFDDVRRAVELLGFRFTRT